MSYPKSRIGKQYLKKADLLRDLDPALNQVEAELQTLPNVPPSTVTSLMNTYYTQNALVSHWYLDKTLGNDANNGTSVATPLKTGAELARRLGPSARWPQSVTIEILQNGLDDPLIVRGATTTTPAYVDIIGKTTTLATGTIAGYVIRNHTTREGNTLTVNGIADLTPYLWKRVRMTSGIRAGGVFWIVKINPTGGGLNTARISQMAIYDKVSTTTVFDGFRNPPIGDSFVIEDLPSVPSIATQIDGPPAIGVTGGTQYARRHLHIWDLSTSDWTDESSCRHIAGRVAFIAGRIHSFHHRQDANLGALTVVFGSLIYQRTSEWYQDWILAGNINCCAIGDSNSPIVSLAPSTMLIYTTSQGVALFFASGHLTLGDVQVFDWWDSPNSHGLTIQGRCTSQSMSGYSTLQGYGLGVQNGATIRGIGNINLQGSGGQARLASTPMVALTTAQLVKGVDFSQKGQTTLVGGTVTVTVPWYDNATQRVTATHATFAGTPGILSITQTSTTQFTITSSNPADTSTVNWQISSLGRGITLVDY